MDSSRVDALLKRMPNDHTLDFFLELSQLSEGELHELAKRLSLAMAGASAAGSKCADQDGS